MDGFVKMGKKKLCLGTWNQAKSSTNPGREKEFKSVFRYLSLQILGFNYCDLQPKKKTTHQ